MTWCLIKQRICHYGVRAAIAQSAQRLGIWLDEWDSMVRFPAGDGNFSLHHRLHTGFGSHPASYPMDTGAPSLGVKRLGREDDH
jgi:hypothetical protein